MAFLDSRLSLSLSLALYIAALTVPPRPLFVLLGCVGVQSTVSAKKKKRMVERRLCESTGGRKE